nr:immunoglobulin light chain junction region [Macaca mulatta]MOV37302.1 immunoglobulin light chain junction region [Macaca mulatta]MOV37554.1 immunoglobulin light chain junction region [Macaca mulatta]MOW41261.1 immunoglobulin light chain junction region [Macaca mulatta]
CQQVYSNPPTF